MDRQWLSPEGHRGPIDCARWACVAAGPMLLTAGSPHAVMADWERDVMLAEAMWTATDLRAALRAFLDV